MHAFRMPLKLTYPDVLMFEFRCSVFTGNIHWLLASHIHLSKQQDKDFHIVFLRNRPEIKLESLQYSALDNVTLPSEQRSNNIVNKAYS